MSPPVADGISQLLIGSFVPLPQSRVFWDELSKFKIQWEVEHSLSEAGPASQKDPATVTNADVFLVASPKEWLTDSISRCNLRCRPAARSSDYGS